MAAVAAADDGEIRQQFTQQTMFDGERIAPGFLEMILFEWTAPERLVDLRDFMIGMDRDSAIQRFFQYPNPLAVRGWGLFMSRVSRQPAIRVIVCLWTVPREFPYAGTTGSEFSRSAALLVHAGFHQFWRAGRAGGDHAL
ncbi:MAG: hypothetical protein IPG20_00125 [Gammaproteobacteria bacterium]|nr:hypothetical protein [Gammaproteobacteria bacterium]